MTNAADLPAILTPGESPTVEFKKSTAEKDRACRTLCAFGNGEGGRVLFGVTPAGKAVGCRGDRPVAPAAWKRIWRYEGMAL